MGRGREEVEGDGLLQERAMRDLEGWGEERYGRGLEC